MATQDDYIKTALRLPRKLHARLLKSSKETGKSMNAEIIARLGASFDSESETQKKEIHGLVSRHTDLEKVVEGLQAAVGKITKQIEQR